MRRHSIILGLLVIVSTASTAQEARRPGTDAMARMQQQLQQLAGERTALQAENARLKERVALLEKDAKTFAAEREGLVRRAGSAESKVSTAEAGQQSASARLESTDTRLNEVMGKYKELAEQLRTVESERNSLARQAAANAQAVKSCSQQNLTLADIATDALDRYERKGCFGALAQAEPFTRLKRVEIENAVEESRERIDALRLPAPDTSPEDKNVN